MENGSVQAPGGDGGAVAPQAPAAPVAPAAPAQPVAPVAPQQPTGQQVQQTAEDQAQQAEDDEWAEAQKSVFPGLRSTNKKKDGTQDEQTQPEKKPKDGETPQDPNAPKKPDAESGASDDPTKQGEQAQQDGDKSDQNDQSAEPSTAISEARATARQLAEQKTVMVDDVRGKLYPNLPATLTDVDGDPINGPEDVMNLINPATGEAFTEEEAYSWYLKANDQFKQQLSEVNGFIEQVADTMLAIKDEADYVNAKYGEWLKNNPEKRDELWAEYSKSLQTDPNSGVILKMPFSLKAYYERVMPSVMGGTTATPPAPTATDQTTQAVDPNAAEKARQDAERARQQTRADRSDIYQPPSKTATDAQNDQDADEWAQAAESVFGDQLKGRK